MESRSRLFGSTLQTFWRLGVGFVLFGAASSVFLAGVGWFHLSLPPWTAGVFGLLVALFFDQVAWKTFDARSLEVWNNVPAWQFWLVSAVFVAVLVAAGYFILGTFSGDPLCHHGITNSILAFGSPVRDLGSFDRFVPYHALGNSMAAIVASAIESLGGPRAVEVALDIVSLVSLAVFLGVAAVLFVLLLGVFRSSRLPGPIWLCFVFPLLVFGAGPVALAQLMPDVLNATDGYPRFESLTFHPLIQYVGRRSAVPGFVGFLIFLCLLLLAQRRAWSAWIVPFVLFAMCFVLMAYASLDLLLVAVLMLFGGLLFMDLRRTAWIALAALAAAAPLIATQGGFFTAALFNDPLPDAKTFFAWQLRAPALVIFFRDAVLGEIPLGEFFSWKILAVELPWFLLSLPLAAWLLVAGQPTAERAWMLLAVLLTFPLVAAPFLLLFAFSPWDLQRLFFWPMLYAALLAPFIFEALCRPRRVRLFLAGVLLLLSCSSSVVRNLVLSPNEKEMLLGRAAAEFRQRLDFDPQAGKTWIASVGGQDLLFMNGCRVLAPAFGTAGPVYYKYSEALFDAVVQRRLAEPDTAGANMGLLSAEDLAFLRRHRNSADLHILQSIRIVNNDRPMEFFVVRLGDK